MDHARNLLFVGPRGSGKSYCAQHLLCARARSLVADPAGSIDDADFVTGDADLAAEWVSRQPPDSFWRVVWRPGRGARMREGLATLTEAAEESPGLVTLFVDELGAVRDEAGDKALTDLTVTARMGRHNEVSVWCASQRLTDIPAKLIAVSDEALIFGAAGPRDHERIRRELDASEDKGMLQAVQDLQPYHFVRWSCIRSTWEVEPPVGG